MDERPFYAGGLRFDCTRCQRCCRHQPGYVFLSQGDLEQLAAFLGLSPEEVRARYCREVQWGGATRLSLRERADYDCVFWGEGGCSVYPARPLQCRSFPFWASQLVDQEHWDAAARDCPGIGLGPLHSALEIDYWLARRAEEPLLVVDCAPPSDSQPGAADG